MAIYRAVPLVLDEGSLTTNHATHRYRGSQPNKGCGHAKAWLNGYKHIRVRNQIVKLPIPKVERFLSHAEKGRKSQYFRGKGGGLVSSSYY